MRTNPTAVRDLQETVRLRKAIKKRRRSGLRQRMEHAVFVIAAGALRLLPRGLATALGRAAARLFLTVAGSRRRILLENLAHAFPEKTPQELAAIARASVESFGAAMMEFIESPRFSREEILERVTLSGEEHLAAARARGKGVILLTAHFGNWEMGAFATCLAFGPVALVVRPLDNPYLEEELRLRRTRFGNWLIPKREAVREVMKAMRRNEMVALLVDQNVLANEAVFVPFFGRDAATTPSVALIQQRTGAAVVPLFAWPLGNGRYRLTFEPPILPEEFAHEEIPRAERARRATARYTEVVEEAIRKDPAAWLWIHNRWRTRPQA